MRFLDKILGGKKPKNVTLTEMGKEKAEQMVGAESTIRFKIASDLDEHGASSISEIAERTGYPEPKVRMMCEKLIRDGWCRTIKGEE